MRLMAIEALIMAVFSAVVAWSVYGLALTGLGLAFRRSFGLKARSADDLLLAPWIGWGLLIGFLQIWHLFLPINGITAGVVILLGLICLMINYWDVRSLIAANLRLSLAFGALLFCTAIFVAYQTTQPSGNYDTGLYHITCIRWASEYSIVPGLANLRYDRAFNNANFLYVAMLNWGPFFNKYHHIASGLLILAFLARGFWSLYKVVTGGQSFDMPRLIDVCLIVPVVGISVNIAMGASPTPDLPMFLLDVVIGVEVLRLLIRTSILKEERASRPASDVDFFSNCREEIYAFGCLLVLTVTRLSVKMSGVSTLAVMCVLSLVILARFRVSWMAWLKIILRVGIAPAVIFLTWAFRGIILSGYPFIPSTLFGVNVDWQVPEAVLTELQKIVRAYPRMPGPDYMKSLESWCWLRGWLEMIFADLSVVTPVLLCLAVWLLMWRSSRSGTRNRSECMKHSDIRNYALFLLLPACSIILCLVKVPHPRYTGAHIWLLGTSALAFWLFKRSREVVLSVLLVYSVMTFAQQVNILNLTHRYLYYIGPLKSGDVKLVKAPSGLEVWMPVDPEKDQCWNAPLPNTPCLDPNLRLRVPGDLSKGFTVKKRLKGET